MKSKKIIEYLSYTNANYNNPEQAITTANLCDTISRDINTDSQRFIYELLQNADDASNQTGTLNVSIDFVGDYVIFSHNGEAFSELDIESISSAGDGTKSGDTNKTGFKGIGFKSVFSHSKSVIIKSGDFCFKFDKQHWSDHWNDAWGSQSDWKLSRKLKNKDENLKMPWQIIPIWTILPTELKGISVFENYNVSTIIRYDNVDQLKEVLNELFSKSQIVLFLRCKQIKISINLSEQIILEKKLSEKITSLKRNGIVLSDWLINTEQFKIPIDVQNEINRDDKSPKKLKEAQLTEISFAIQLENNKLKSVEKESRLIFTYLPTSINFDLPFLVNASFLTDAGRQHLHQDIYWNNWLFKQIPISYFSLIADLAKKDSEYNTQILSVLPHKHNGTKLGNSFNEGFEIALKTIAFMPNINGDLLKVKEAIFDQTKISEFISPQVLINHINEKHDSDFSISSLIPSLEPHSTLRRLGIRTLDINDLEGFFASEIFNAEHHLDENYNLISFLYNQTLNHKEELVENNWNDKLGRMTFIFDENEELKSPEDIYFPANEFSSEFSNELNIVHGNTMSRVNYNSNIKKWLRDNLGIVEPSALIFIEKTIIRQGDTFVTQDNAINVGRFLFKIYQEGLLKDSHYKGLFNLPVLTQEGSLKKASSCYLSDYYEPAFKIENLYNNDFFISEEYVDNTNNKRDWGSFLIKIGIKQDIEVINEKIEFDHSGNWKERFDFVLLEKIREASSKVSYTAPSGTWYFYPESIDIKSLPFFDLATDYNFSKVFFERIFENISPESLEVNKDFYVNGSTGFVRRHVNSQELNSRDCPSNYFKWILENQSIFPVSNKTVKRSSDVLINTVENRSIGGDYLDVLDYSGTLSPEWKEVLKFKEILSLADYLEVLSKIWKGSENSSDDEVTDNRQRIGLIYEKIAQMDLHHSEKEKIQNWSKTNKLLAANGKDFYYPNELSVVTIEGFKASNLIFIDNQSNETLDLLGLLGVKIIDKVIPTISSSKVEINDLKIKLKHISPLIALVSVEKSKNKKEWENEYGRIQHQLSKIQFFETTEIYLSYGNEDDRQKKSSWAKEDNFYYVGNWYSPRILDGLVEPLGSFLKIRYAERILTVLLLESFSGGIEYLKEKFGEDIVNVIPEILLNPTFIPAPNISTGDTSQSNEEFLRTIGRKGELAVFDELKKIYSRKYGLTVTDTKTGFNIGNQLEVFWRNISENTTANHDFKIIESGKEIYIDSKATKVGKNMDKIALYISGAELELMERAEMYLIARVYNVITDPTIEFVKLKREDMVASH
ncbi:ATP-binding protein [Echinicola pacifica]|nr:ATP-binding protein [Echinicola pacifica]